MIFPKSNTVSVQAKAASNDSALVKGALILSIYGLLPIVAVSSGSIETTDTFGRLNDMSVVAAMRDTNRVFIGNRFG